MTVDNQILEAIKSGQNQKVLNILYERTLPSVKALIRKMNGSNEEALDIFQEAVVVFYKQVKNNLMQPDTNVDGYIVRVSRNLYLNKLRKLNRETPLEAEHHLHQKEEPAIEHHLEMMQSEKEINELLEMLGDNCKELLKAIVFEELDQKEIASKLGYANSEVVKTQKYRCKKKLEELLLQRPELIARIGKLEL